MVAGDEVYGGNPKLRAGLEERGCGYVLAVARTHEVPTSVGKFRADTLAKKLPKRAWQKLSAGAGAKGHRFYDWAVIDLAHPGPGNEIQRLFTTLVIRPVHDAVHRLGWSHWRRRHQAHAQASHYRRQAANQA